MILYNWVVYAYGLKTDLHFYLFSPDISMAQTATEWTASRTYFSHAQPCDVTRVQGATEWTASVHTSHTSKPVM